MNRWQMLNKRKRGDQDGNGEDDTSMWLNIGLWLGVPGERYSDAAQALAERLVRDVPLAGRAVLDVGCGNGDAALLYAKSFGAVDVLGVNISATHVEVATRRALAVEGSPCPRSCIPRFQVGDGTSMPEIPTGSRGVVLALECAFHFHPSRELFFHEAFRILEPGGHLAMTDIITADGLYRYLKWSDPQETFKRGSVLSDVFKVPGPNQIDRAGYKRQLEAAGFVDVVVESIFDVTIKPFLANLWRAFKELGGYWRLSREDRSFYYLMTFYGLGLRYSSDYVVVSARKPGLGPGSP